MTSEFTKAFDLIHAELKKSFFLLPAVHEDQIDNVFDGGVTCAITCVSMLLQTYNLPRYNGNIKCGRKEEDVILTDIRKNLSEYQRAAAKIGIGSDSKLATEQNLRTHFMFLKWYVQQRYAVELLYSNCRKIQLNRLIDSIDAPFIMSTSNALTPFGHIILARGRVITATGLSLIANDPWGIYPYNTKKGGEEVVYDTKMFPTNGGDGKPANYHILRVGNYPKK